jgi:hypothetical protein
VADDYESPHDSVLRASRLLTAFFVSLIIEVIRVLLNSVLNRPARPPEWTWIVGGSVLVNVWFHWWSPPNSGPKTVVSAAYNQTTLPYLILWTVALLRELALAVSPALRRWLEQVIP